MLIKESLENEKPLNLFSNPNIKDPAEYLVTKNKRDTNRKKKEKEKEDASIFTGSGQDKIRNESIRGKAQTE